MLMSGRYLLDTNIIIALLADELTVKENLADVGEVFIPSIVIGELCYGAYRSSRVQENLKRIEELASSTVVLSCDMDTARQYGMIKNGLRMRGRPIPENDIWIASIALQHGLILISRDVHFDEVEGLQRISW